MMDVIHAVQGRPFASMLVDPFGLIEVPIDVGGGAGEDFLSLDVLETLKQLFRLSRALRGVLGMSSADYTGSQ